MSLADVIQCLRADIRDEYLSRDQAYPWIVGFSAGKDSTALLQLVLEAVLDLPPDERTRPIHVLLNDTLVESPVYMEHVDRVLERLKAALPALGLPCIVHRAVPEVDQTFWVNLIGRGYPSPNRQFRWCTDRMKISPTNAYIKSVVSEAGQAVMLLGVRRDESSLRAQSIDRHDVGGKRLHPHGSLPGCLVYRPIVDLSTDDLWSFLLQTPPPWGGSHRGLVTLYRNTSAGECPLVLDKADAPSCGSSSYRFGCWTCTVVQKDRSMAAQIDAGHEWLEPLMEFRDYLQDIRSDFDLRDGERRNGQQGIGPFTVATRQRILARLLEVQAEVGRPLISDAEIRRIREIWSEDLAVIGERRFALSRVSDGGQGVDK
jgi:DNA sulfur modification protein DndC